MSDHRPGRHRAPVRPRYGRLAALSCAAAVTAISVLASTGATPIAPDDTVPAAAGVRAAVPPKGEGEPTPTPSADPAADAAAGAASAPPPAASSPATEPEPTEEAARQPASRDVAGRDAADEALPADSGTGRRAVFSESRQRVWIVDADGTVARTYLASGSTLDNLDPGTYEVYSRSRWAVGIENSGVMEYFVRFTRGPSGAAIGFHSIPTKDGEPVQTLRQLGTPLSHGCIRQKKSDAVAMWEFADIGTTVVVTP